MRSETKWSLDLAVVAAWSFAAAAAAMLGSPPPLRVLLALPFVLVLPGYALVALLAPGRADARSGMPHAERLALSLALSLVSVIAVGLVIHWRFGASTTLLVVGLSLYTVGCCVLAQRRRARLEASQRFEVEWASPSSGVALLVAILAHALIGVAAAPLVVALVAYAAARFAWKPRDVHAYEGTTAWLKSRARNVGAVPAVRPIRPAAWMLASLLLAMGALGFAATQGPPGERYTELYLVPAASGAEAYPRNLTVGGSASITLALANHEHRTVTYRLDVEAHRGSFTNGTPSGAFVVEESRRLASGNPSLEHGETWRGDLALTFPDAGLHRIDVVATPTHAPDAVRRLVLWVHVAA